MRALTNTSFFSHDDVSSSAWILVPEIIVIGFEVAGVSFREENEIVDEIPVLISTKLLFKQSLKYEK